jgi:signal transduction histidine kinase
VERLTEATKRFGAGELGYRIEAPGCRPGDPPHGPQRSDELGDLMRAWNEMAERIQRLVLGHRELLANVSHELRSPLARMRVALELLPKTPESNARLADVEQDILELERLIDDVLTASRLEATGLPAHPEPASIASLFDQLKERAAHDPLLSGKDVRFESSGDVTITADAALLKRALWNLIENAAKYGAAPIVVAAERTDGRVRLSVRDHGPGVPAEERERVFAPFARLDKARTPDGSGRQGFGLGLTIARRVAEAHGGTIRLEGEPANRFVLDLPLAL